MLNPPHLELKTGCESTPAHPTSPPPRSTSPHLSHHHTSSTYLYSLRSWAGGGGGGAACIRGLTMIKTHREEPLKSPVPKMESLIGAYSARKGFSERKKSFWVKQQSLCPATLYMSNLYSPQPTPFLLFKRITIEEIPCIIWSLLFLLGN